ncbi:hybrid sensor histidine kinase/response regulator [Paludibaculum fermentans]|uniref:histidine kinase n=1 Tax=Paludibaculum fermentans TaxID=1473598 RepID=A0A7S7SLG1_PALFE|nr:hybrid sensor histidine kinase/response regulator [Paludibaculum fermentans]QOY90232.1 response regulator [Paludibaculum fermentans]
MSSLPFVDQSGPQAFPAPAGRMAAPSETTMTNPVNTEFEIAALDHMDRLCAIGRDASRLTHDLNNQFTTIRGFCEIILGNLPHDHPLSDFAQEVSRSCGRALETLRKLPVSPAPPAAKLDSSALIATLLEIIAHAPGEWPQIETSFPQHEIAIRASNEELTCILDELMRLACANSAPSGRLTITAQTCEAKAKLQFLLSKPRRQWNSGKDGRIALLMLTAGLDRLGGSLTTSSVTGGEAALKITLPTCYRQSAQPPSRPFPRAAASTAPTEEPSVLVVDDEAPFRAQVRNYLTGKGYKVTEVANGNEAMVQLGRSPHQLVLLDLFMAEPDGFETLRRIRMAYPALPVVVMSGAAMEYLHAATLLGAAEAISKSEIPDRLAGIVRDLTVRQAAATR